MLVWTVNMRSRRSFAAIPVPVARALRKLGHDIRDARRRRRIPVTILAERASISRTTLHKAEKGDPGVSLGTYATVLLALGRQVSQTPRVQSNGRGSSGVRGPRKRAPPGGTFVGSHAQGPGKRHF